MLEDFFYYCSYKLENKFKKGKDIIYLFKRVRDYIVYLSNKVIYLLY